MKKLHKLRLDALINMEAGQFVKRNLTDLELAGVDATTDLNMKNYTLQMQADTVLFDKAQLQNHKSGDGQVLEQLDKVRDTAFSMLHRQVKVFELSDIPAEVAAYKSLKTLFANYKNLPNLNYEAETGAINQLLQELGSDMNEGYVETLKLSNYVTRLQTTNEEFSTQFSQRNADVAATIKYEAKNVRRTMLQNYTAFANYVVSLANATDTPYYNGILEIVNVNRKYYSDMLARRQSNNKAPAVDVNVTVN